jgi:hypothetical protein
MIKYELIEKPAETKSIEHFMLGEMFVYDEMVFRVVKQSTEKKICYAYNLSEKNSCFDEFFYEKARPKQVIAIQEVVVDVMGYFKLRKTPRVKFPFISLQIGEIFCYEDDIVTIGKGPHVGLKILPNQFHLGQNGSFYLSSKATFMSDDKLVSPVSSEEIKIWYEG